MVDYHTIIEPGVTMWEQECISKLTTQEIVTLTDMLLLSYQVVQASFTMSQARLIIQSELFNIVSLSINDTFDARIQAQNNDLTTLKKAILSIEQAQEQIKFACDTLKNFGPIVININPMVIQLFIANLKTAILHWAKIQHNTVDGFDRIQNEFIVTANIFNVIKNDFEIISSTDKTDHHQLLHGANNVTDMYKKIENLIAQITTIRQQSIVSFNTLLTFYFKAYYEVFYNHLKNVDMQEFKFFATSQNTLPYPDQLFTIK